MLFVENERVMENGGIRPSSSASPMLTSDGSNQTLRNAFSQNPLNVVEKYVFFAKSFQDKRIIYIYLEVKIDHHRDRMVS